MRSVRLGEVARIFCAGAHDNPGSFCREDWFSWGAAEDAAARQGRDAQARAAESGWKEPAGVLLADSLVVPAGMDLDGMGVAVMPVPIHKDLVAIVVEPDGIDRNYLRQFLISRACDSGFCRKEGAEKREVAEVLENMEIPLLPLEEQRQAARILDKSASICQKIQAAIRLTDGFLFSVFSDMFGDPVKNPKGWPHRPLQDLVDCFRTGLADSEPQAAVAVVDRGRIATPVGAVRHGPLPGDVAVRHNGNAERCLFVTEGEDDWEGAADWYFRPRPGMVEAVYLARVLSGVGTKTVLERISRSVCMQSPGIDLAGELLVPLPPLSAQQRYAQIHAKMHVIRQKLAGERFLANRLFRSLAASFFATCRAV